jgi:hypothetical protein
MRGRQSGGLTMGSFVDFYRVDAVEQDQLLRLRAEVRAPGAGWMEWLIKPQPGGNTLLSQNAYFAPKGLVGFLYWYLLFPFHRLVFAGLIKSIAQRAME